eukprot:scaffold931_cov117-Isochrysis_galbana.AAC.6
MHTARRREDGWAAAQSSRVSESMTSDRFCESAVGSGGERIRRSAGGSAERAAVPAAARRIASVRLAPAAASRPLNLPTTSAR